ncbi:MAG: SelT/SelW/SelH family protein [Deltaproteobacteria bacterium]|nr:MAG: SelT/SelW/SelH family protein [Deltaproteobacteria bacterium]
MPRASRLEAELKKQFGAEVELIPGSGGIYEIMADGRLVFSKKAAGRFAEPEEIISLIQSHG